MRLKHRLNDYHAMAEQYLAERGLTIEGITSVTDAWKVADRSGITQDAYDRGFHDGHVRTALDRLFPNVAFHAR